MLSNPAIPTGYSCMCSGVKKNDRIIISIIPMILSDHSAVSESTKYAAIIKTIPGSMAIIHDR